MRFALLYSTENGDQRNAIVNDSKHEHLPHNPTGVLSAYAKDFNDGAPIFVIALPGDGSGDIDVTDQYGDEVRRSFIDL